MQRWKAGYGGREAGGGNLLGFAQNPRGLKVIPAIVSYCVCLRGLSLVPSVGVHTVALVVCDDYERGGERKRKEGETESEPKKAAAAAAVAEAVACHTYEVAGGGPRRLCAKRVNL